MSGKTMVQHMMRVFFDSFCCQGKNEWKADKEGSRELLLPSTDREIGAFEIKG
jgi:hypothetical protein